MDAIRPINNLFQHEENDAVLLLDASKAFNSLNRGAALRSIRVLCPALATFAINAYRAPARPFVTGSKELISAENTTQRDRLVRSMSTLGPQPLISPL